MNRLQLMEEIIKKIIELLEELLSIIKTPEDDTMQLEVEIMLNCKSCAHYKKHPALCHECWKREKNHYKPSIRARIISLIRK